MRFGVDSPALSDERVEVVLPACQDGDAVDAAGGDDAACAGGCCLWLSDPDGFLSSDLRALLGGVLGLAMWSCFPFRVLRQPNLWRNELVAVLA
jgi:hypothetical protein